MKVLLGRVTGKVQGVWFRRFVAQGAISSGVTGYARNLPDGSVEVALMGAPEQVREVQQRVEQGPPNSRVDTVSWEVGEREEIFDGFQVL